MTLALTATISRLIGYGADLVSGETKLIAKTAEGGNTVSTTIQSLTGIETLPAVVTNRIVELNNLVSANPLYLSVADVAEFLHMKPAGLRSAIEHGSCPFGFGWKLGENRACKIPTATFYLWYTNGKLLI